MAVLIVAEVEGQTAEAYDQMMVVLRPLLNAAPGFVAQGGGPSRHTWRVFEVWESLDDATRFFAAHIRPALPPGVTPARTVVELRNLILTDRERSARG